MFRRLSIFTLIVLFGCQMVKAQDTTWVQTFTLDDITKRRDSYASAPKDDYRKILMYYTLKCDPKTKQDGYNCGEWDYLSYNFLYDHDATFDSVYRSIENFKFEGASMDQLTYGTEPVYDDYRKVYTSVSYTDTLSLDTFIYLQNSTNDVHGALHTDELSGFSQYLWTADELKSFGLKAGKISGLQLQFMEAIGTIDELTIGMKHVKNDTLSWENRGSDFQVVYQQPVTPEPGFFPFSFSEDFDWNGTDAVLIQVETRQDEKGAASHRLTGGYTSKHMDVFQKSSDYCLDFNGAGDHANFGSEVQVDGSKNRTIEVWARAEQFNSAGLFQGGVTGSRLKDWSLRTLGTDDEWRIQLWGEDADVTLDDSKDEWHHYALVQKGSLTQLFYDGKMVKQKSASVSTGDADLMLGRWANSFFNGQIDELRVWSAALNRSELLAYMHKEIDASHPKMNQLVAQYGFDEGNGLKATAQQGKLISSGELKGNTWWKHLNAHELYRKGGSARMRPATIFEQGSFLVSKQTIEVDRKKVRRPGQLLVYGNEGTGKVIRDNAKKHPSIPTDTISVWEGEYTYVYDELTGETLDSNLREGLTTLKQKISDWYSPTVRYEIGRYITPYGINLSLGAGFTWVYDVTDYAPLLFDSIDLAAGNQQELIDLKFAFIKGTPTHEVKRIDRIWNHGTYSYKSLDDDTNLAETEVDLVDGSETYLVRTRLTGHGHNSDNGEAPHCCEWRDNEHYLSVNGKQVADWHIWTEDCDLLAVYPQGGNWVGAREGWCPGDVVRDYDFDITQHVKGYKVAIDYDISDVPSDNLGMGNGNYRMSMQLFQYGKNSFDRDAELYMVKRPNKWEYYNRINPACEGPLVTVKNTGKETITSLKITYGVSGGKSSTYDWTGRIEFMKALDIELPIDASDFWVGDDELKFTASVSEVNGSKDENAENDDYDTYYKLPAIMDKERFVVQLRTNNVPEANFYEIRDATGKLVDSKGSFAANEIYSDTFDLAYGCYTFEFFDEGYGLDYWAWPAQGKGSLLIRSAETGRVIKVFDPDFGEKIYWPFAIGTVSSIDEQKVVRSLDVFPNPSTGAFRVDLNNFEGDYTLTVFNATGQLVEAFKGTATGLNAHQVNLGGRPGVYFVRASVEGQDYTQTVVIE